VAIILIATILRFYKLAEVPHGMTWDEAAIGYNGFALIKNHRDEWLKFLPISFQSFGDYKAPLAIYLNGLFTFVFGLNLWAVRLPFALSGVAAVAGLIFLTQSVLDRPFFSEPIPDNLKKSISLIAGLILAISPWHLHFSRAGFESGLALTFIIWGMFFFWSSWSRLKSDWQVYLLMAISVILLVASIYAYHSSKIMLPFLFLCMLPILQRQLWKKRNEIVMGLILGAILLTPFINDSLFGLGASRFKQTTVFGLPLTSSQTLEKIGENTLAQFSLKFFVSGETTTLRHGDGRWGVLFLPDIFLVLSGLAVTFTQLFKKQKTNWSTLGLFALSWAFAGMLPALIGREVPHPNRTLLALPGFILLEIVGLAYYWQQLRFFSKKYEITGSHLEKDLLIKYVSGLFILFYATLFMSYFGYYYQVFAKQSAADFSDGYLDAFKYIIPYELGRDGRLETSKIIFTSEYGQPYIYALFSRKTTPIMYQSGSLVKYEFKDVNIGDLQRHNSIVVAGKDELNEIPIERAHKVVYGSDGEPRFKIFVLE
jgi:4-amino-4-deoxy-L-arabinose transferase-like glycosyltransferase